MNTPAHAVLNLVVLERGRFETSGGWILAGAVVPDVPNMVLFGFHRWVVGLEPEAIYPNVYDSPMWQAVLAPSHSLLLVGLVVAVAAMLKSRHWIAFGLSAGLHVVGDLLTHASDAHPHLWPLSDARWSSPVSYWDRGHFAAVYVPLELVAVLVGAVIVWRRGGRWRRVVAVGAVVWLSLAYVSGAVFWGS